MMPAEYIEAMQERVAYVYHFPESELRSMPLKRLERWHDKALKRLTNGE